MIHRSLLAVVLTAGLSAVQAQTFDRAMPVASYALARAMAVDAAGNVYSCGNANDQVDFDPGPGEALSPPGSGVNGDVYVVKYDNAGNYLWHYLVGASSTDIAKNVAVDANGDVLVTGYCTGSVDWDPGPGTVTVTRYEYDAFLLKLSSEGELLWVRSIGGDGGETQAPGLAVDAMNNVYVAGYYSADVTFGDGALTLPHTGDGWDAYYAKYGPDGTFLWAKGITGTGLQRSLSIACSGADLYVYGAGSGETSVAGTHTLSLTSALASAYLCKTDTAGNVRWAKAQSGLNANSTIGGEVVRANATQLYVFASFIGTVDADPGDGVTALVPPTGSYLQTLIARLDTSGQALWAHQLQGNVHFESVGDIALDGEAGVVFTCAIAQPQDFDPGPGEVLYTPVQPNDLFTARYRADGSFHWVRTVTTGGTFDTACGAGVDANGNVFMTGSFGDSAVFDPGPTGTLYTNSSSTAFTVKYGVDLSTGLPDRAAAAQLRVMPNPTHGQLTVTGDLEQGDALHVMDAAGREVLRTTVQGPLQQLTVGQFSPGVYLLRWTGRTGRGSTRFVVQ